MSYNIDYSGEAPQVSGGPSASPTSSPQSLVTYLPPKRGFEIPSILKTGGTLALAGALFFGAEAVAPAAFKPSMLMGTYDARVSAAVKAAELQQQVKYEAWAESVKLANAQNLEQYRATSAAIAAHYTASYDRARIFAGETARIQTAYVNARLSQAQQRQAGDMGIVNLSRVFGRLFEAVDPGAGASALAYADRLSGELERELTEAAQNGQTISVEGWNTDLPPPADVQRDLAALRPVELPPMPVISSSVQDGN